MAGLLAAGLTGPGWPEGASSALRTAGAVLAIAGALLAIVASRALGKGLSPYPRPSGPAVLVERGPYRWVRHPIYLGGILFFVGFSLAFSPWALAVCAALAVIWALKLRVEERMLETRFPEYRTYRERTRARLVPFVY